MVIAYSSSSLWFGFLFLVRLIDRSSVLLHIGHCNSCCLHLSEEEEVSRRPFVWISMYFQSVFFSDTSPDLRVFSLFQGQTWCMPLCNRKGGITPAFSHQTLKKPFFPPSVLRPHSRLPIFPPFDGFAIEDEAGSGNFLSQSGRQKTDSGFFLSPVRLMIPSLVA